MHIPTWHALTDETQHTCMMYVPPPAQIVEKTMEQVLRRMVGATMHMPHVLQTCTTPG